MYSALHYYVPLVYSWTTRHSPTVPSTEWISLYTSRVVLIGRVYFTIGLEVEVIASRGLDSAYRSSNLAKINLAKTNLAKINLAKTNLAKILQVNLAKITPMASGIM
jgi:hypothetical protein